ncbi:hypothetical protein TRFO_11787 [Tritrichomonas foetus]|uniref:DUF5057 domain-containing protein n=1 Tax=Tritrichomonas foetus TaxID=1144522 RepID=A0A1J4J834_9EUKA|nr:hypothetical protein TRFO_11787 [Tritrichomonas foetus]|eukprot:OHS93388.1 hypothetical protein TRFO_11787 [Tritrichomonas foetus]
MIFTLILCAKSLTLEYDQTLADGKGGVKLDWSDIEGFYTHFRILRYKNNESPQTISAMDFISGDTVKVLNVYPVGHNDRGIDKVTITYKNRDSDEEVSEEVFKSALLKIWMEGGKYTQNGQEYDFTPYGALISGTEEKQLIYVDKMPSDEFTQNEGYKQIWDYDVVMLGTWDTNNANTQTVNIGNQYTNQELDAYLKAGFGILFGHDTLGYRYGNNNSYGEFASRLNMKVGMWENSPKQGSAYDYNYSTSFWGANVTIKKEGLLTSYPWDIGGVGTKLRVPYSHTCAQLAFGDVWLDFEEFETEDSNKKLEEPKGEYADANFKFYLTSNNNIAMIQTGHKNCESTDDERKIIANTLFYLKQRSNKKDLIDNDARDYESPNNPTISFTNVLSSLITAQLYSDDVGTKYGYIIHCYNDVKAETPVYSTEIANITITSNIKGYYYLVNSEENAVNIDKSIFLFTSTGEVEIPNEELGINVYLHAFSVDNNGHESQIVTTRVPTMTNYFTQEFHPYSIYDAFNLMIFSIFMKE